VNNPNDEKKIKERSFEFAIKIIQLVKHIPKDTTGFVIGKQLIKSGTSIGANVEEATGAYSKDDFTYKMSIALKEARETNYWLRLLRDSGIIINSKVEDYIEFVYKLSVSVCHSGSP
jgi:four helix bundle protein